MSLVDVQAAGEIPGPAISHAANARTSSWEMRISVPPYKRAESSVKRRIGSTSVSIVVEYVPPANFHYFCLDTTPR